MCSEQIEEDNLPLLSCALVPSVAITPGPDSKAERT